MFDLQHFADDQNMISRTDAGALIPEEESKEIMQGAIEQSAVLTYAKRLANMGSKTYKLPVLSQLPVAYFVDGDNGQKGTTKQAWDKKVITAEELAVIVPIPQAVLDDSDYDIWGEVRPRLTEAFGRKIDAAILFGDDAPTSWPTNIVAGAKAAGNTKALTSDLYSDIMGEGGVIGEVEEDGYFVSGHVADVTMRAKLRGLKDTTGQPIFVSSIQNGGAYTLDGSSMNFPRNGAFDKTKALMISGDWSQLVYSIRQDMSFEIFREGVIQNSDGTIAYNLLQDDMVALRAVMRLGWQLPNPVNGLETDANKRYPFAVLTPTA